MVRGETRIGAVANAVFDTLAEGMEVGRPKIMRFHKSLVVLGSDRSVIHGSAEFIFAHDLQLTCCNM